MEAEFKALVALDSDEHSVAYKQIDWAYLGEGDVDVAIEYSTLNYKDALAMTNASPIVQKRPLVLGIDYAGTVVRSADPRFQVGDRVVRNGFGASERFHGGYAQYARANADYLLKLPEPISTRQAMALGTAGYTAMLCVLALEEGISSLRGEKVLVTGAAGGVGSVAITLLATLGADVIASTGRQEETDYLLQLGASEVISRDTLSAPGTPMGRECWAAVIDSVGSHTLANAIAQTRYGGVVAACGLAQGADLPATVLPFILRSVRLQGVDSVQAPMARREQAWQRLAQVMDRDKLDAMSFDLPFEQVLERADDVLAGRIRGRAIVSLRPDEQGGS